MDSIDILGIDREICTAFDQEILFLPELEDRLNKLNLHISTTSGTDRIMKGMLETKNNLLAKINKIKSGEDKNFYITETLELLRRYRRILRKPIKVNFMKNRISGRKNTVKNKIVEKYLEVVRKYNSFLTNSSYYAIINTESLVDQKTTCNNCGNTKDFEIEDGGETICAECCSQQICYKSSQSSYNDMNRVNIISKYIYDRKIHFRECINQYQGKQNCAIPQKVFTDLEERFESHNMLLGDKNSSRKERYKNIKKKNIQDFLKDLGYVKQYENTHLIYSILTTKKLDDITHLEEQLLRDFETLQNLYEKMYKNTKRKSFINTQFVLYILLLRYKHPCKEEDFSLLRTQDRKTFHDTVCSEMFQELGWKFTPVFG